MEVCIAAPSVAAHGGAERVVCEQARHFTEQGHGVVILAAEYDPAVAADYGVPDGVPVVRTDGSLLADSRRLRRLIAARDVDVCLTHSFAKRAYLATRFAREPTPYVPHVHGSVLWFVDEPGRAAHVATPGYDDLVASVPGHGSFYRRDSYPVGERVRARVEQWLEGRALRHAAAVTTGSEQVRREVAVLYGVEATIARPGVAASWVSEFDRVETRALTDAEATVLSVSRLDPRKRVDLLVEAIAGLRETGRDVELVVGGTGEERDRLERLATRRGVASAVTFAGYVPEADLASYYRSADAFACPGWMSYGITPLEAYAMRTPVAVSADAFVHEVLDGHPGVCVVDPTVEDWERALAELLEAPEDPDPSVVPTWDEFCSTVEAVARRVSDS
jgi:glycosyltransferase involved in cell wall biosynthesis